jgi:hypothetical protein
VYQDVACKSEIFKVFTDELAHGVLVQAGRLGEMDRVQPGPMGLAEIRSRLGELSDVIQRHRTTFALWPFAERDEPTLRGPVETLLRSFADVARPALAARAAPAGGWSEGRPRASSPGPCSPTSRSSAVSG